MCYSAQVWANYRKFCREFGATLSVEEFAILYFHDKGKSRPKTPKAMDDAFAGGDTPAERHIWRQIQEWNAEAATKAEQELFTQTTRLNTAQRALQAKVTKKAQRTCASPPTRSRRRSRSWPTCGAPIPCPGTRACFQASTRR